MGLLGDVFKIGGAIIGGSSAKKSSKKAQAAQVAGLNNAMGSVNTGFDTVNSLFEPYLQSGTGALSGLNALLGIDTAGTAGTTDWAKYVQGNPDVLAGYQQEIANNPNSQYKDIANFGQFHYNTYGAGEGRDLAPFTTGATGAIDGDTAQASAIADLKGSPLYESLFRNGQDAILSNASATGGLRGGNIQGALANFGKDTLSSVIQQQIANLAGVASSGQQAAGSVGAAAGDRAAALAKLMTGVGDTNAGGILQRSTINSNMINQVASGLGGIADSVAAGGIKF